LDFIARQLEWSNLTDEEIRAMLDHPRTSQVAAAVADRLAATVADPVLAQAVRTWQADRRSGLGDGYLMVLLSQALGRQVQVVDSTAGYTVPGTEKQTEALAPVRLSLLEGGDAGVPRYDVLLVRPLDPMNVDAGFVAPEPMAGEPVPGASLPGGTAPPESTGPAVDPCTEVPGGSATTFIPLGTHVADLSFELEEMVQQLSLAGLVEGLLGDFSGNATAAAVLPDTVAYLSRQLADEIRRQVQETTHQLHQIRLRLHVRTPRFAALGTPLAQGIANTLRHRMHLSVFPLPGYIDICPAPPSQ
jgi:hypothetical protein